MKAIIAYNDIDTLSSTEGISMYKYAVVPDSAIIRAKDPFFKPDGSEWTGMTLHGVIIDRLGKGISTEYATRYYNNCLTAVHPFDPRLTTWIEPVSRWSRDGALVVSPAQPICDESKEVLDIINSIITKISYDLTLKTGDLVLYGDASKIFQIESKSADYMIPPYAGFKGFKLKIR